MVGGAPLCKRNGGQDELRGLRVVHPQRGGQVQRRQPGLLVPLRGSGLRRVPAAQRDAGPHPTTPPPPPPPRGACCVVMHGCWEWWLAFSQQARVCFTAGRSLPGAALRVVP